MRNWTANKELFHRITLPWLCFQARFTGKIAVILWRLISLTAIYHIPGVETETGFRVFHIDEGLAPCRLARPYRRSQPHSRWNTTSAWLEAEAVCIKLYVCCKWSLERLTSTLRGGWISWGRWFMLFTILWMVSTGICIYSRSISFVIPASSMYLDHSALRIYSVLLLKVSAPPEFPKDPRDDGKYFSIWFVLQECCCAVQNREDQSRLRAAPESESSVGQATAANSIPTYSTA